MAQNPKKTIYSQINPIKPNPSGLIANKTSHGL